MHGKSKTTQKIYIGVLELCRITSLCIEAFNGQATLFLVCDQNKAYMHDSRVVFLRHLLVSVDQHQEHAGIIMKLGLKPSHDLEDFSTAMF
jgi:hypothetical protein